MEKTYNGYKMISTEKLATKYGFSANDKKIKVREDLYQLDSNIIWEEAILVRQLYCDEVSACKSRGEKPKPSQIKSKAFEEAKQQMANKYGETYFSLFSDFKKVKEVKPTKPSVVGTEKTIDTKVVEEVNNTFLENTEELLDEFDNTESVPRVKIKLIDVEGLGSISSTEDFKPRKDMIEVADDEVAVDNLEVFDIELDVDDLFNF